MDQFNQSNKLIEVIENDMCIACGVCVEACDRNQIVPAYNEVRACNEVRITDVNNCLNCPSQCISVCPSVEVDFAKLLPEQKTVARDGNYLSIKTGFSHEHQFNGVSSSGGILRSIIQHFIKSNVPVVCLAYETEVNDGKYNARLIRTLEDMKRIPGSIYHSISFTDAINQIRNVEKCAVVAISCHLEGLMKFVQTQEPELGKKIIFKAGIICGWMYSDHSFLSFAKYKGIDEKITDIGYRGEDRIGKLKLYVKDQLHSFSRNQFDSFNDLVSYRASYSTDVNRLRCRTCQNHTNYLADVAVGDAWLKRKRGKKLSVIISRTEVGEKLINQLSEQQKIVTEDGNFDDIVESQGHNLVFGTVARKLNRFLSVRGLIYPRYIYEDNIHEGDNSLADKVIFRLEFLKRSLIRSEKYRTYKIVYMFSKLWRLLDTILRMKVKKIIRRSKEN